MFSHWVPGFLLFRSQSTKSPLNTIHWYVTVFLICLKGLSTIFANKEFRNLTTKYITQNLAISKTILESYYKTLNKLKFAYHKPRYTVSINVLLLAVNLN